MCIHRNARIIATRVVTVVDDVATVISGVHVTRQIAVYGRVVRF